MNAAGARSAEEGDASMTTLRAMKTVRRLDINCGQTYLFELPDGGLLEAGDVFMAHEHRYGERPYRFSDFDRPSDQNKRVMTICSMSGCPVGCRFCASARTFRRNLTADEIVGQVLAMAEEGARLGRDPDLNNAKELRVLYTRMGEPMLNAENVISSVRELARRYPHVIIGMSTSGFKKGLELFLENADVIPYLDMQFSLHSTNDEERRWLFNGDPGVTMLSIPEIAEYVERWWMHTAKRTSLNVILFEGYTYDFKSLLRWFDREKIWLRLSPWNVVERQAQAQGLVGMLKTDDVSLKRPVSSEQLARIIRDIEEAGIAYAYAPAIDEEIVHAVACGQALEAFQSELTAAKSGKKTRFSLRVA
jgi:adenine C2-methylase RlmN of 23S rRNA A2503 and tRNA A37